MSKVISHWSADTVVLAAAGAVLVLHLLGLRATFAEAKRPARPLPAGVVAQAVAFYCGLCAVLVAPLSRFMLVAGTVVVTSVLSMVLMFDNGELYHGYAGPAHRVLSVVSDQQVGGSVLFAIALPPFLIVGVALSIRWLATEESEALNAGFDRLLKPRASAWPSRPGLR